MSLKKCTLKNAVWAVLTLLLAFVPTYHAETQETETLSLSLDESLGLIEGIHIFVDDQVSDDCWTNSNLIKNKMALLFEQSNISVKDAPHFSVGHTFPAVEIHALGFREENNRCVGYSRFSVIVTRDTHYGSDISGLKVNISRAISRIFTRASVFTSSDSLNEQIEELGESFSAELAASVIGKRRLEPIKKTREVIPGIFDYMSQDDFNALITKYLDSDSD